jgi:hypothetical protein
VDLQQPLSMQPEGTSLKLLLKPTAGRLLLLLLLACHTSPSPAEGWLQT